MDSALFIKVAKALSDPQRFALLERIAQVPHTGDGEVRCECACMALVSEFPITQATISHHLKELANADLISIRREGKCGYFSLRRDTLAAYQAELARRIGTAPAKSPAPSRPRRGPRTTRAKGGSARR